MCSSVGARQPRPNPSVEARPNGRPPGPGWWYAYIFTSPGLASCRRSRLTSNVRPLSAHLLEEPKFLEPGALQASSCARRLRSAAMAPPPSARSHPRLRSACQRPSSLALRPVRLAPCCSASGPLRDTFVRSSTGHGRWRLSPPVVLALKSERSSVHSPVRAVSVPWRGLVFKSATLRQPRPNPSFEARPNGVALGPRGALVHHAPRGPSATPSVPPQLQR